MTGCERVPDSTREEYQQRHTVLMKDFERKMVAHYVDEGVDVDSVVIPDPSQYPEPKYHSNGFEIFKALFPEEKATGVALTDEWNRFVERTAEEEALLGAVTKESNRIHQENVCLYWSGKPQLMVADVLQEALRNHGVGVVPGGVDGDQQLPAAIISDTADAAVAEGA